MKERTTKSDRQDLALVAGLGVLVAGTLMLYGTFGSAWTLETTSSKLAGMIIGGFLCILGAVLVGAALDVLDELNGLLQDVWDSFLGAIGR